MRSRAIVLMVLSGVAAAAWAFFVAFDVATNAPWLPVHVAGFAFSIGTLFTNIRIYERAKPDGTDRRTDQEIHSSTDAGTVVGAATYSSALSAGESAAVIRPRKRAVERTGIILGEIVAYRCWRVAGDYLLSMNGAAWLPDAPMDGAGVDIYNSSGVHAFKSINDARSYADTGWVCAIGEVRLWGTIVEHETGYRGEKARIHRIVELVWSGNRADIPEVALSIAKRYSLMEPTNV